MQCWASCVRGPCARVAGGVHEAGCVLAGWAGSPVVDEVVGDYRLPGDVAATIVPTRAGTVAAVGGKQVVPAERAASVLLGEQAQRIAIQRGFDLASPRGPVLGQVGVIRGCPAPS